MSTFTSDTGMSDASAAATTKSSDFIEIPLSKNAEEFDEMIEKIEAMRYRIEHIWRELSSFEAWMALFLQTVSSIADEKERAFEEQKSDLCRKCIDSLSPLLLSEFEEIGSNVQSFLAKLDAYFGQIQQMQLEFERGNIVLEFLQNNSLLRVRSSWPEKRRSPREEMVAWQQCIRVTASLTGTLLSLDEILDLPAGFHPPNGKLAMAKQNAEELERKFSAYSDHLDVLCKELQRLHGAAPFKGLPALEGFACLSISDQTDDDTCHEGAQSPTETKDITSLMSVNSSETQGSPHESASIDLAYAAEPSNNNELVWSSVRLSTSLENENENTISKNRCRCCEIM